MLIILPALKMDPYLCECVIEAWVCACVFVACVSFFMRAPGVASVWAQTDVCVHTCSDMHRRRIHTIKLNRRQLIISVCLCQIPQQLLGLLYFEWFFERQAWRCSGQHELSVLTDRHLWINYRLCVLQSMTEIAALHVWWRFYLSLVSTVGRYQNNFT